MQGARKPVGKAGREHKPHPEVPHRLLFHMPDLLQGYTRSQPMQSPGKAMLVRRSTGYYPRSNARD